MEHSETNKMGTKPIFPLLMSMAFPPMVSMLIQSMYNIVDSIFVSQIGESALTAVSLAFPIQNLLLAVAVGTGVGVNSFVSRKLGEKQQQKADSAVMHGLLLAIVHSLIFILLGLFCIEPFFRMFTSADEIFKMSCEYTYVVVFLAFGTQIHIAVEKSLQATGSMVFPMLLQAVGAIVNIILDPIMIFGLFGFPAMGVKGAAVATVIGQITAMVLAVIVLLSIKHDIHVDVKKFRFEIPIIREIYSVGVSSMLMTSLGSFLVMGLNGILIQFSNLAVSVFGIYFKLQTFVFMPVSGLVQGTMPIMGFNYGSFMRKRLLEALRVGIIVSVLIMIVGCLVFLFFPVQLLQMFNASDEMLSVGVSALRIISFSYVPAAFSILFATLFQAMAKGFYSLIIFLLRQLLITLPLAYLLSGKIGLEGVWISFPVAEMIGLIVSLIFFYKVYHTDPIFKI